MTQYDDTTSGARAIETIYAGFRFRSRLEARWAVFYDCLGVQWEYEKEGYDLGGVGWYLPDFWLPTQQVWVEIKPEAPTEVETSRCARLAEITGRDAFMFFGQILLPIEWGSERDTDSAHKCFSNSGWDNGYRWCECPACGLVGIEFEARADRLDCRLANCPGDGKRADRGQNGYTERLTNSYIAARQARFGKGGKG